MSSCRARELDNKTANELKNSRKYGTQTNSCNDLLHRTKRTTHRKSVATEKGKIAREERARTSTLQSNIDHEKNLMKEAQQRRRDYVDELQELRGTSTKVKRKVQPEASSSGRVSSASRKLKARLASAPYTPRPSAHSTFVLPLHLSD